MVPDLWLTVVPKTFAHMMEKAKANKEYAQWLGCTDSILRGRDYSEFDDKASIELKMDVEQLKKEYRYTAADFFYDEFGCTDALDYLLNDEMEARGIDIETYHNLIREGGSEIDVHCRGYNGSALKIYRPAEIRWINRFIGKLSFSDLSRHYDDEKPVAFGVHALQVGNQENVAQAFAQIQTVFRRAATKNAFILKKNE